MSNMMVDVRFLAGSNLEDAVAEAKEKSRIWGICYVCFTFNGVRFSIGRYADVAEAVKLYEKRPSEVISLGSNYSARRLNERKAMGCWTPYRTECDCPACGGFND